MDRSQRCSSIHLFNGGDKNDKFAKFYADIYTRFVSVLGFA